MTELNSLGGQLRLARQEKKLSTRQVVERLPHDAKVSHVTLASYEKGATTPDVRTLAALAAVYGKPASWFLAAGPALTGVQYRMTRSAVTLTQRRQFEAAAARWLGAYWRLDRHLARVAPAPAPAPLVLHPALGERPWAFAGRFRAALGLAEREPLTHLVRTVEERLAVRVVAVDSAAAIAGAAGQFDGGHAVVLNPTPSAWDRLRLTFAHEVAHILYRDCDLPGLTEREVETQRFEFGFYLLMPPAVLREAFAGRSVVRLVKFKEAYGVSLAAMVYRAGQEGLLPERDVTRLWVEFAKRGWKKAEPGAVRPDRPTRFEERYESAVAQGLLSPADAELVMGVSEADMLERVAAASGGTAKGREDDGSGDDDPPRVIRFPGRT